MLQEKLDTYSGGNVLPLKIAHNMYSKGQEFFCTFCFSRTVKMGDLKTGNFRKSQAMI